MASDDGPPATGRSGDGDGSGGPPGGQMIYQLFAADERRWIVSIFLENHALAFSPAAIAEITDMDAATAEGMLDALAAGGVLRSHGSEEALEMATTDGSPVERLVGDPDDEDRFYRLDKESPVARGLARADEALGERAREFLTAAPDVDYGG